ncbi:hypothetical protein C8N38_102312 [Rhodovulum kholense]|uniref:Uncharacterized protein n=1 Tax=Rhodovulum kholense TaxID=453584 RepID=A0A8E2VN71_9RHOB|nr:hypothetical protein C8N38_102312 [Rhodovulum kholense]
MPRRAEAWNRITCVRALKFSGGVRSRSGSFPWDAENGVDLLLVDLGEGFEPRVAAGRLPFVVLLEQHGAGRAYDGGLVWECGGTVNSVGRCLPDEPPRRQRGRSCSATLRIRHCPRTDGGQWLVLVNLGAVGLVEGLADRGGDDGVLAVGQVRQRGASSEPGPFAMWPRRPAKWQPLGRHARADHAPNATKARAFWDLRTSDQNVSASKGPMPDPMISRRRSVSAATAIMAATGAMRPS